MRPVDAGMGSLLEVKNLWTIDEIADANEWLDLKEYLEWKECQKIKKAGK